VKFVNSDYIYEEKIFAKVIGGILGVVSAIMLIVLIYQITVGPLGDDPAPTVIFLILFIIFLILTLIFSRLVIRISFQSVTVGYGIIKKRIPMENIEDCEIDKTPAIKYGGAGIRTARIKGEWVLVYNVVGGARCVLKLKEERFKKFVFSTKNPEEVVNVIKGQLVLI
jgi:hypothetical protein